MLELHTVSRRNPVLHADMMRHYSKPKGLVGRSICYVIRFGPFSYGHICAGSATRFLPGRDEFLSVKAATVLNRIASNTFFHIERREGGYPIRNFAKACLLLFEATVAPHWQRKYGDQLIALETLVELPRTGECYRRAGWQYVGETKGYTCKRTAGQGTDSWTGKRIWDTDTLRPKSVFMKKFL